MARTTRRLALLAALVSSACGASVSPDVDANVTEFHQRADGGRAHEIQRVVVRAGWETYMHERGTRLGRVRRTSLVASGRLPGTARVFHASYNSEFERGYALEHFFFRMENGDVKLIDYLYQPDKQLECNVIRRCRSVDVPLTISADAR